MVDTSRMRRVLFLITFCLTFYSGFSQNLERYNWYFGSSTQAIRFNRTSAIPSIVPKGIPFGAGGSATASDPGNANLLFYTDGQSVYDVTNLRMPNGFGLLANATANQPVAICPVPGQTDKYFIFANTGNFTAGGAISVSVVSMTMFGNAVFPAPALGDVESKNVAVGGLANRSEGMIVVPHANGTDFWLITHQVSSQTYSSTLINAASYTGTYVTTSTGGLAYPTTVANFSYHAASGRLAVSPQDANTDAIILNFDNATGAFVFNNVFILNSGEPTVGNQNIYDIEWSPSGDFIYLSRFGEPGLPADLLQYDLLNATTSLTSVLPAAVFRSFGVQIGPDSAIYHLYQAVSGGPILLGKMTKPDTIASEVNYLPAQLTPTSFAGTQFPSFAPPSQPILTVDFTFIGTCQGSNTIFFPDVQPRSDSVNWDFDDGSNGNQWSPVHRYGQPTTYNVRMTAFYLGQTQSVTKAVTIQPFPIQLNLVQDTTACRSEFPPPRGTSTPIQFSVTVKTTGGTPTSYTWSNGDLGATLTPDSAGYYYVVVSDGSGCSAYAGVNVKEYGLQDQRANVWYFGNRAGIDFNTLPNPPVPLSNSAMNAPEGCAIICDRNGNPIFYTDGENVYNKNDVLITTAIGGDPVASQSSIIVPVPGDETLYYIFTNEAIDGTSNNAVKYSLFDLKQNAGLGAVVSQDVLLFSKGTERLTASGNWLIIHEYGNNTFRAYSITPDGIGSPVLTAIGSDHNFSPAASGEGYMKLGPNNLVAVALSTGTSNLIELFTLVDSSGVLINYRKIDLNEPSGQVYGIEFSGGGNKVFATVKGNPTPSQVFEYSIDSVGQPHFKQRVQQALEIGAIQMAPDGQIYMAINGSNVLGTIQPNDDTTSLSAFNFNAFTLAPGTNSRLGLPNFIQQINNATGGPSMDVTGVCLGSPTTFIGTPTDAIDELFWFFGDGGSDNVGSTEHTYAAAGTYNVTLRVMNRCGLDTTLVKPHTIVPPPGRPTIPGASALCNGPITLDANTANLPGFTYLWSDGQTTKTVVITQQAIISVTITDPNGCESNATTLVADNQPQVDLGPDQTLCQNTFTSSLDAQNPGHTFNWTVNGGTPTSAQTRPLDTTVPGVFTYQVIVSDPITTCTGTDQATFTIVPSPSFTLAAGVNPTCGSANGSLILTINNAAGTGPLFSYFLSGSGPITPPPPASNFDQTAGAFTFNSIQGGIYSAVVTDQISQCTIFQTFAITDATWTANAAGLAPNCDPVTVQITTVGGSVVFPVQYNVTTSAGTSVASGSGASTPFNTTPVTQGTYTIQLTDNAGCTFGINNFAVTPNPPLVMTVTPTICATPPTITASGATTYAWSGTGTIVGPTNGASIQVSGQGQFVYTVTGSSPGNCPNTQNTTVTLDNPAVNFTQSDPCQAQVILDATPSGNYTYRWYRNGSATIAQLGQQIAVGVSENNQSYVAEALNSLNGCAYRSASKTISVIGLVDAGLSATPACDDNKPFTLTATTTATGVIYAWFRNNTVISGQTSATTSQTDAGLYRVDITKGTCTTPASLTITKAPLPIGELSDREIICNDPENTDPSTNQVDLDPGSFTQYSWFKNELTLNYTQRVFNATSQGRYRVDLTNSFGCVASDQVEVRNECIPRIEAPNAFRPGSTVFNTLDPSLKNSEFWVLSSFIKDDSFQIFIYNRWGELVYTSPNRDFRWNGGFNNTLSQPVPGGSYAYIIKYVSSFHPERGVQEKRGGVALLR